MLDKWTTGQVLLVANMKHMLFVCLSLWNLWLMKGLNECNGSLLQFKVFGSAFIFFILFLQSSRLVPIPISTSNYCNKDLSLAADVAGIIRYLRASCVK